MPNAVRNSLNVLATTTSISSARVSIPLYTNRRIPPLDKIRKRYVLFNWYSFDVASGPR